MEQAGNHLFGADVARQNLQLQSHTLMIATQAENLLKLLSELRYNLLFSDVNTVAKEVNDDIERCRSLAQSTQQSLSTMRSEVEATISNIELALLPHTASIEPN